ncbi:MAG: hypothetical protein V5A50_13575, partial [Thiohalorhabdus sp.]
MGGKGEGNDRLLAMIQDFLGAARGGDQSRGEAGKTVLDLLARFREGGSEASLGELIRADNGRADGDKTAPLSALSLGGLPAFGGSKGGSMGLTSGQSQSGGSRGSESLANLLTSQLQGQGASAAGGEAGSARGPAAEGSTRDSANRLAGSDLNGREGA